MRKFPVALVLAATVLIFSAEALATEKAKPAATGSGLMTELGAADFQTYCAACHGVAAKGDGTVAEFLTIPAPDLTQLTKKNAGIFPRERIAEVIDGRAEVKVHGARDMPVWGDWFDTEAANEGMSYEEREAVVTARINALLAWIESIQE